MRVSDGPVGVRGTRFGGGPPSIAVPCSTLLAATWDPPLVRRVGELLGRQARAKGARVLLAPTVNLHRTPPDRRTQLRVPVGQGPGREVRLESQVRGSTQHDVHARCHRRWAFGIESIAPTRLLVDGIVVIDNESLPKGGSFFGTGKAELTGSIDVEAGHDYLLEVEIRHHRTGQGLGGVNIGGQPPLGDNLLAEAVDIAVRLGVAGQ